MQVTFHGVLIRLRNRSNFSQWKFILGRFPATFRARSNISLSLKFLKYAYLPLTFCQDQKLGWHCALHYSCSYSCFVTETTDPYVIQRCRIKPSYPSNGSSETPPNWLFALYFPISAFRAGRRRRSAGRWMKCRSRRSPLFSGAQRVAKTSKGGSCHCAGGPSLAGSGSARHTCVWLLHMSPRYRIRARVNRNTKIL